MKFSQFKHQHQNQQHHQIAILMFLVADPVVVVDSVEVEEVEEEARGHLGVTTFNKKERQWIFLMIHLFHL